MAFLRFALSVCLLLWPGFVGAGNGSLFVSGSDAQSRFSTVAPLARAGTARLISGDAQWGLFDRPAARQATTMVRLFGGSEATKIRDVIAAAEAGPLGYNAVQYGAVIKTPHPPTQMTLAEIFAWIDDTPGQPHAIGRYQFIPTTLSYLVEKLEIQLSARFSPVVQDQLGDALLAQAGLHHMLAGKMERHDFMNNLARIWAGLPNSSGKSHYEGYAGNKAVMTWDKFDAEMARIFPG
jgi:muramidase (phage lysozyme)